MGDCIVDAGVLHGAGDGASFDSIKSRQLLEILRDYSHIVLCSHAVWNEWQSHLSKLSALWQSQMVSRDQIVFAEPSAHHSAQIAAAILTLPAPQRPSASKDAHLLELAVSAGALVLSPEQVCRRAFCVIGRVYAPVSGVHWVSPLTCPHIHSWLTTPGVPRLEWLLV